MYTIYTCRAEVPVPHLRPTHNHPAWGQLNTCYCRDGRFFISVLEKTQKKICAHLANTLHTPRTYLTCAFNPVNNKTSTMRGHKNYIQYNTVQNNTGTSIQTAKRGFLRMYIQSGLTADNTQSTQRRSCCVLRLLSVTYQYQ